MNVAQLIANILITASYTTLVGIGFSLIFRSTRFFDLAYAFLFVAGPYSVFFLNNNFGITPYVSIFLSLIVIGLMGVLLDAFIYKPLRCKNANSLVLLLSSLGVYVILQNIISILFGDGSISIKAGPVEQGINILGAKITTIQILLIGLCVTTVVITNILIRHTRIGLAIRAVGSSSELANVSGIESEQVILWATFISSLVISLAGIIVAFNVNMNPTMGMNALMMGIVVVLIGGLGSIPGIVLGALFLASAQHSVVWVVGSQWQDAIAFVILLAFLLIKPEGIMGKKLRKSTV